MRLPPRAVLLLALLGCSSTSSTTPTPTIPVVPPPVTPGTGPNPVPASTTWVPCAKEYSGCSFEGLRNVRFNLNGVSTVRSFFGGLPYCDADRFGVAVGGSGAATCDYQSSYLTRTIAVPKPGMAGLAATVTVPMGDSGVGVQQITTTSDTGVSSDIGAFREPCTLSHFAFDDPIVFPGQPGAAHLHMFFGNAGTDANSTSASLTTGGNSTCAGGTANRTAYWVPALIDGNGNAVVPASEIFYYKTGYLGVVPATVKPMPAGLRFIAGSAASTAAQSNASWGCWEVYIGHLATIGDVTSNPKCAPGNHLVMSVSFPQCWNGVELDSPDHKSHMAFATGSGCPSTHPVPLPEISLNITFTIPKTGTAGWHIASDMYDYATLGGGLSLHGDWFNGWDPAVEKTWITNCENKSKDCHAYLLGDGRTLF